MHGARGEAAIAAAHEFDLMYLFRYFQISKYLNRVIYNVRSQRRTSGSNLTLKRASTHS